MTGVMNRAKGIFLYDADCGFCTKFSKLLERVSAKGTYDVMAWQNADLEALGLTPEACADAAWFVTNSGSLFRGSDGIGRALREGTVLLRPLGVLVALPGIRALSHVVYRWVAKNRYLMPGASAQCRMPDAGVKDRRVREP